MAPLTLRYNNPGALEFKPWMTQYGARLGENGRYAAFDSPDQGYAVMGKVLDTYQNKHGLNTVSGIVNRWAPPTVDNNSTSGYIASVAKRLGVDPNAPLTPEHRTPLMQAMAAYEAGTAPAPMGGSAPIPQSSQTPGAAPMPPGSFNGWTPEAVQQGRGLGTQLMKQGIDASPVQHWTQALARVLQAGSGATWSDQATAAERQGNQAVADTYRQGLSGGTPIKQIAATLMGNPFGMDEGKGIAKAVIAQELKGPEKTPLQKDYEVARSQGFTGTLMDFDKQRREASRPQTTIDMKGESEAVKARAKAGVEAEVTAYNEARSAGQQLQQLAALQARLERLKTGATAPAVRTAAGWAKDLGVSPDVLKSFGIPENFVGDAQAFEAATSGMLVNKLGSGGFPSNNFSNADREFLERTLPRLGNDPRANRIMVEAAKRVEMSKIEKAKAYQQWRQNPENKDKTFFDFDIDYSQQVGNRFDDLVQEARTMLDGAGSGYMPQPTQPGQATPQQNGGGGQIIQGARQMMTPPPAAIEYLRNNPATAAQFDEIFGQGAAASIMGAGQQQQRNFAPPMPLQAPQRNGTLSREVLRNG